MSSSMPGQLLKKSPLSYGTAYPIVVSVSSENAKAWWRWGRRWGRRRLKHACHRWCECECTCEWAYVVERGALSFGRDATALQGVVGEHEHERIEGHDKRERGHDDEQQRPRFHGEENLSEAGHGVRLPRVQAVERFEQHAIRDTNPFERAREVGQRATPDAC